MVEKLLSGRKKYSK